jgi:nicotinic acid mononucleotide adenylyltransferase
VRERLSRGEPVAGLIPEAALREIEERGLYGYTARKQERT